MNIARACSGVLGGLPPREGLAPSLTIDFGGYSGRVTPVPIPNTEVKTASADGTWGVTPWESRTPPDFATLDAPSGASSHFSARSPAPGRYRAWRPVGSSPYVAAHPPPAPARLVLAPRVSVRFTSWRAGHGRLPWRRRRSSIGVRRGWSGRFGVGRWAERSGWTFRFGCRAE